MMEVQEGMEESPFEMFMDAMYEEPGNRIFGKKREQSYAQHLLSLKNLIESDTLFVVEKLETG